MARDPWDMRLGNMEQKAFSDDTSLYLYWCVMCPSTFVKDLWTTEELNKVHNDKFFFSTPQNQKLCSEIELSCLMYRLGQHNNFVWMGMPTTPCDAMAKLNIMMGFAGNIPFPDQNKKTTSGFDFTMEKADSRRLSHYAYLNGNVLGNEEIGRAHV